MPSIERLLNELDEVTIAQRVTHLHDAARMSYPLQANTVPDARTFERIIGDYVRHHLQHCHGSQLPMFEAVSRAKQLLERGGRDGGAGGGSGGGSLLNALDDARWGTGGGLRRVLDRIADGLRDEAMHHYVVDTFDRHVALDSFEQRVEIIRQFMARFGHALSPAVRRERPERYANDYRRLIQDFVQNMHRLSSSFRRI
ncbi:MAG: hypothetical protein WD534_15105 [Phycisphaeraceae bacterium]